MKGLKIISLYGSEKRLIEKAMAHDREAQQYIYKKYAPKMLGLCRQYIRDLHFAEDVMVEGFIKVFNHLGDFAHKGSFEGWIRRIMVNQAISFLRKQQFVVYDDDRLEQVSDSWEVPGESHGAEHIQRLIDQLPEGYKMVFVLFAVEGYKHQEIAAMLGITESTSKSQLFKARKLLQEQLKEQNNLGYGTK